MCTCVVNMHYNYDAGNYVVIISMFTVGNLQCKQNMVSRYSEYLIYHHAVCVCVCVFICVCVCVCVVN